MRLFCLFQLWVLVVRFCEPKHAGPAFPGPNVYLRIPEAPDYRCQQQFRERNELGMQVLIFWLYTSQKLKIFIPIFKYWFYAFNRRISLPAFLSGGIVIHRKYCMHRCIDAVDCLLISHSANAYIGRRLKELRILMQYQQTYCVDSTFTDVGRLYLLRCVSDTPETRRVFAANAMKRLE